MLWKFIQYSIHLDKIQTLQKIISDKISITRNALFFFRELQLIAILLLICNSDMSWSTKLVSQSIWGIFHFRYHSIAICGCLQYSFFIIRIIWILSNIWFMFIYLKRLILIVNGWLLTSYDSLSFYL